MIKQIDDLTLPPSITGAAELFNNDTTERTVSNRLITKLSTAQKWRVVASFDSFSLAVDYQAQFYSKCSEMRQTSKTIIFVSPYDGTEVTITAKCLSIQTPTPVNLYQRKPQVYANAGAVFEEV